MHVGIGLVEGLEIGLLGDALPGERRAELVVHHLDLLVDEDVRQLERRVRDGVLDDAVGEPVPRPVEGVALEARLDVRPQGIDVGEVTERADEVGVEVGQDLLAQLAELDREMRLCPGHLLGRVVVGEGDVELGRTADLEPFEIRLEARDEALLAEDERHPLGRPTLERRAVARSGERDDRVVAGPGAATLDRGQRRVLVAQLLDDLVDTGIVDGLDLGAEVELLVVAELDLGADLDGRLEGQRTPLLRLDHLDVGVGEGQDVPLDDGLAVRVFDEVLDRFVEDDRRAKVPLEHGTRRLARTEAGDPRLPREAAHGRVDGLGQAFGRDLDLEHDRGLWAGGRGDLHRPGSIGRAGAVGRRPPPCSVTGRTARSRDAIEVHRLLRPGDEQQPIRIVPCQRPTVNQGKSSGDERRDRALTEGRKLDCVFRHRRLAQRPQLG